MNTSLTPTPLQYLDLGQYPAILLMYSQKIELLLSFSRSNQM